MSNFELIVIIADMIPEDGLDKVDRLDTHYAKGARRALAGRLPIIQAIRGIREPERVREYLYGYMSVVATGLSEIGITSPTDIDVHESLQHVVIQDGNMSLTSGIEGLRDGMMGICEATTYERLGTSPWNHYQDGQKIGFAYARSLVKKGNFESLGAEDAIPDERREVLMGDIASWLEANNISGMRPDMLLHFHPIARQVFARIAIHGSDSFDEFQIGLIDKVNKNPHYSAEQKKQIIQGIPQAKLFSEKAVKKGRRNDEMGG